MHGTPDIIPGTPSASDPHRDVVGTWAAAARKHGLRFGVTVHQARNWWWFQPSHERQERFRWQASLTMAS